MLVLPAEPPDACLSRRLKNWNFYSLSVDSAAGLLSLTLADCFQCAVINRLHKPITQGIQRSAQSANIFGCWYVFLHLRTDSAIVDNRTAGNGVLSIVNSDSRIYEIAVCIVVANTKFGELTRGAAVWILVA